MTVERADPPFEARGREMLNSWLEFHRATLAWKCDGLTDEQLRQRSAPPSTLSLLGLVRHMAEVERGWFRRTLAGEDAPPIYFTPDENPGGDVDDVDDADVAADLATWRAECEAARKAEAAATSLDVTATEQPWAWRRPSADAACSPGAFHCAGFWCTWSRSTPATMGTPTCSVSESTAPPATRAAPSLHDRHSAGSANTAEKYPIMGSRVARPG